MIALLVLAAFVALLAATVAGISLATRNPRLRARTRDLEAGYRELYALARRLQDWSAEALDDPQRRVVYDEVMRVTGTGTPAGDKLRGLAGKDGPHGL
jgi:hypothetical protein